ncbi:hypothetical protein TorRG33x02_135430 [Trema orientale]|uniref:Uncharacterized protein n=1 Tax=Trema orientale TaxID=63057 RepID=A0A2P5EYR3_TREOI|nr:hypothetical protein TorRG33x02_135430 [Trema orientale]
MEGPGARPAQTGLRKENGPDWPKILKIEPDPARKPAQALRSAGRVGPYRPFCHLHPKLNFIGTKQHLVHNYFRVLTDSNDGKDLLVNEGSARNWDEPTAK